MSLPAAAGHRVRARLAVAACCPPELPVRLLAARIAGAGEGGRSRQHQVLQFGAQHVADRALHRVRAATGGLGDRVARIVDQVGVVAETADQLVGVVAAIERVIAVAAVERVVAGETAHLVVAAAAAQGFGSGGSGEVSLPDGSGGGGGRRWRARH